MSNEIIFIILLLLVISYLPEEKDQQTCDLHNWVNLGEEDRLYTTCSKCGYLPESGLYEPNFRSKDS